MAPPKLARQRPIADVAHPVEIFFAAILRNDLDVAALHGRDRGLRQWLHLAEPLRGSAGLDDRAAALADSHGVRVIGDFLEQVERPQILDNLLARGESLHTRVGARGGAHVAVVGHDIDLREMMTAPDLEVVRIVRGSNFHRAGAEFAVHHFVGDDREFRDSPAAQSRFVRPDACSAHPRDAPPRRCRPAWSPGAWWPPPGIPCVPPPVPDMPEMPGALFVHHFQIAQHRQANAGTSWSCACRGRSGPGRRVARTPNAPRATVPATA